MSYIWPIALISISNVIYQICSKSFPEKANTMLSLTFTYITSAVISFALYFFFGRNEGIAAEMNRFNWTTYLMGLAIVGVEVGFIYAYKVGWEISTTSLVEFGISGILMLFIGFLVYSESITIRKIIGVLVCFLGVFLINT